MMEVEEKESGNHFCEICSLEYVTEDDLEEHNWSLLHHMKLDKEKGRDYVHKCSLCNEDIFGLLSFTKHIHSDEHQKKLQKWKIRNVISDEPHEEQVSEGTIFEDQALWENKPLWENNQPPQFESQFNYRFRYGPRQRIAPFRGEMFQSPSHSWQRHSFFPRRFPFFNPNTPPFIYNRFREPRPMVQYDTNHRFPPRGYFNQRYPRPANFFRPNIGLHSTETAGANCQNIAENDIESSLNVNSMNDHDRNFKGFKATKLMRERMNNLNSKAVDSKYRYVRANSISSSSSAKSSSSNKGEHEVKSKDDIAIESYKSFEILSRESEKIEKSDFVISQKDSEARLTSEKRIGDAHDLGKTKTTDCPFVGSNEEESLANFVAEHLWNKNSNICSDEGESSSSKNSPSTFMEIFVGDQMKTAHKNNTDVNTDNVISGSATLGQHMSYGETFKDISKRSRREFNLSHIKMAKSSKKDSVSLKKIKKSQTSDDISKGKSMPKEKKSSPKTAEKGKKGPKKRSLKNSYEASTTETSSSRPKISAQNESPRNDTDVVSKSNNKQKKKKKASKSKRSPDISFSDICISDDVSKLLSSSSENISRSTNSALNESNVSSESNVQSTKYFKSAKKKYLDSAKKIFEKEQTRTDDNISKERGGVQERDRSQERGQITSPDVSDALPSKSICLEPSIHSLDESLLTSNLTNQCEFRYKDGRQCPTAAEHKFCSYHEKVVRDVFIHYARARQKPQTESNSSSSNDPQNSVSGPTSDPTDTLHPTSEQESATRRNGEISTSTTNLLTHVEDSTVYVNANEPKEDSEHISIQSRFKYLHKATKSSLTGLDFSRTNLPPGVRKFLNKRQEADKRNEITADGNSSRNTNATVRADKDKEITAEETMVELKRLCAPDVSSHLPEEETQLAASDMLVVEPDNAGKLQNDVSEIISSKHKRTFSLPSGVTDCEENFNNSFQPFNLASSLASTSDVIRQKLNSQSRNCFQPSTDDHITSQSTSPLSLNPLINTERRIHNDFLSETVARLTATTTGNLSYDPIVGPGDGDITQPEMTSLRVASSTDGTTSLIIHNKKDSQLKSFANPGPALASKSLDTLTKTLALRTLHVENGSRLGIELPSEIVTSEIATSEIAATLDTDYKSGSRLQVEREQLGTEFNITVTSSQSGLQLGSGLQFNLPPGNALQPRTVSKFTLKSRIGSPALLYSQSGSQSLLYSQSEIGLRLASKLPPSSSLQSESGSIMRSESGSPSETVPASSVNDSFSGTFSTNEVIHSLHQQISDGSVKILTQESLSDNSSVISNNFPEDSALSKSTSSLLESHKQVTDLFKLSSQTSAEILESSLVKSAEHSNSNESFERLPASTLNCKKSSESSDFQPSSQKSNSKLKGEKLINPRSEKQTKESVVLNFLSNETAETEEIVSKPGINGMQISTSNDPVDVMQSKGKVLPSDVVTNQQDNVTSIQRNSQSTAADQEQQENKSKLVVNPHQRKMLFNFLSNLSKKNSQNVTGRSRLLSSTTDEVLKSKSERKKRKRKSNSESSCVCQLTQELSLITNVSNQQSLVSSTLNELQVNSTMATGDKPMPNTDLTSKRQLEPCPKGAASKPKGIKENSALSSGSEPKHEKQLKACPKGAASRPKGIEENQQSVQINKKKTKKGKAPMKCPKSNSFDATSKIGDIMEKAHHSFAEHEDNLQISKDSTISEDGMSGKKIKRKKNFSETSMSKCLRIDADDQQQKLKKLFALENKTSVISAKIILAKQKVLSLCNELNEARKREKKMKAKMKSNRRKREKILESLNQSEMDIEMLRRRNNALKDVLDTSGEEIASHGSEGQFQAESFRTTDNMLKNIGTKEKIDSRSKFVVGSKEKKRNESNCEIKKQNKNSENDENFEDEHANVSRTICLNEERTVAPKSSNTYVCYFSSEEDEFVPQLSSPVLDNKVESTKKSEKKSAKKKPKQGKKTNDTIEKVIEDKDIEMKLSIEGKTKTIYSGEEPEYDVCLEAEDHTKKKKTLLKTLQFSPRIALTDIGPFIDQINHSSESENLISKLNSKNEKKNAEIVTSDNSIPINVGKKTKPNTNSSTESERGADKPAFDGGECERQNSVSRKMLGISSKEVIANESIDKNMKPIKRKKASKRRTQSLNDSDFNVLDEDNTHSSGLGLKVSNAVNLNEKDIQCKTEPSFLSSRLCLDELKDKKQEIFRKLQQQLQLDLPKTIRKTKIQDKETAKKRKRQGTDGLKTDFENVVKRKKYLEEPTTQSKASKQRFSSASLPCEKIEGFTKLGDSPLQNRTKLVEDKIKKSLTSLTEKLKEISRRPVVPFSSSVDKTEKTLIEKLRDLSQSTLTENLTFSQESCEDKNLKKSSKLNFRRLPQTPGDSPNQASNERVFWTEELQCIARSSSPSSSRGYCETKMTSTPRGSSPACKDWTTKSFHEKMSDVLKPQQGSSHGKKKTSLEFNGSTC